MNLEGIDVTWTGHSGVKLVGEKIIYIDPFNLNESSERADIILITHGHHDHCSIADIKKIVKADTVIVAPPDCQSSLSPGRVGEVNVMLISPEKVVEVHGIRVEAVPAYNTNKQFHQKREEWVGYIVNTKGKRVYHAGDTDFIPEMHQLESIDIAFLPVSGTYTMNAKEAAEAANAIRPKVAVPIHYGSLVGSRADAETFKSLAKVRVEIL